MSVEIWSIVALALMLLGLNLVQGALVPLLHGFRWGLGSRDEPVQKSALQGRLERAVQNQIEAMLAFVPLMGIAIHLGVRNEMTELAAWLVIGGRLAFIPLYLSGVFALRSFSFGVALTGTLIVLFQLV